jgi:hypothetical protein
VNVSLVFCNSVDILNPKPGASVRRQGAGMQAAIVLRLKAALCRRRVGAAGKDGVNQVSRVGSSLMN